MPLEKDLDKVVVKPSSIPGAGDGVFAAQDISLGDQITWLEFSKTEAEVTGVNYFLTNYYEWFEKMGSYELADPTQREVAKGVAHLVNDGAKIDANGDAEAVKSYVRQSNAKANVELFFVQDSPVIEIGGTERTQLQGLRAIRDIGKGEELFRTYGANFWLRPLEFTAHRLMDFARVDLRLVASFVDDFGLGPDIATATRGFSHDLFHRTAARLTDAVQAYDDLRIKDPALPPFQRFHPQVAYNGYAAWLWVHLPPPALRRDYAQQIGLYNPPFLSDGATQVLRRLHEDDIAGPAFPNLFRKFLSPPFTPDHDLRCQQHIQASGSVLALGQSFEIPW